MDHKKPNTHSVEYDIFTGKVVKDGKLNRRQRRIAAQQVKPEVLRRLAAHQSRIAVSDMPPMSDELAAAVEEHGFRDLQSFIAFASSIRDEHGEAMLNLCASGSEPAPTLWLVSNDQGQVQWKAHSSQDAKITMGIGKKAIDLGAPGYVFLCKKVTPWDGLEGVTLTVRHVDRSTRRPKHSLLMLVGVPGEGWRWYEGLVDSNGVSWKIR